MGKHKRVKLDRQSIVEAAIERIERHGLDELSARKLAQDLGCEAMSLYHHIGNMDALQDAIVDELLSSIPIVGVREPAEAIATEATAYLALARTHPRAFRLVATRRWKGDRARAFAARVIGRFSALGLASDDALARARILGAYLNGAGLAVAAWEEDTDRQVAVEARRVDLDLRRGLATLIETLTSQE